MDLVFEAVLNQITQTLTHSGLLKDSPCPFPQGVGEE